MTKDTLDHKLKLLNDQETKVLASLRQNQAQAEQIESQRKSLEQEQIAVYGAKLMIQELQKELAADNGPVATPAPVAPVVPITTD